jgi:hypothetical protein
MASQQGSVLVRILLVIGFIGLGGPGLWWLSTRAEPPLQDYVEYWAGGKLNATGGNPYSSEQLLAVQREVGWTGVEPIMMWNPPWTLTVVMPLGLLPYPLSRLIWLLLSLAIVIGCSDWAWRFYGGPGTQRWIAWLVAGSFVPTLVVLKMGQVAPLILLGVAGFLHFERRGPGWCCGALAMLAAVKPHLIYLFWAALLLWILERRRWSVLIGAAFAGLLATAIPLLLNPDVIAQYRQAIHDEPPTVWVTSTVGALLRLWFGAEHAWLQFVPTMAGLAWFLPYWVKHRRTWDWAEQMPLLLAVSFATASFGWLGDQVVLLLVVIRGACWVLGSRRPVLGVVAISTYLGLNALAMLIGYLPVHQLYYVWTAPAALAGYLLLRRGFAAGALVSPENPGEHVRIEPAVVAIVHDYCP